MENNQQKDFDETSFFQKDFEDFEEEKVDISSQMDSDLEGEKVDVKDIPAQEPIQEPIQEITQEPIEEQNEPIAQEISPWEKFDEEENSAVKKYIFYVSKDFVPYIDNLTTDERSAYINDAIQKKIDFEIQEKNKNTKRRIVLHFVVMVLTFILAMPFVLWFSHKAIMATFDNYKYSQENFEKLYKERFSKDRAYMRSIQYNKEQKEKNNKNK